MKPTLEMNLVADNHATAEVEGNEKMAAIALIPTPFGMRLG